MIAHLTKLSAPGVMVAALAVLFASAPRAETPPQFLLAWGTQGAGNGQFDLVWGVAADRLGNVFTAEEGNDRVQKFTSDGTFLTTWGSEGSGNDQFNDAEDLTTDTQGNVFVSDNDGRIQEFTGTGTYLATLGGNAPLSAPFGVAVNPLGDVYVADYNNSRVVKFAPDGSVLMTWGTMGSGDGEFQYCVDVALDAYGNVYAVDEGNNRIQKFTSDGVFLFTWGSYGSGEGEMIQPEAIALDAAGNVYVADSGNGRIEKFTGDGAFLTAWGSPGSGNGEFDYPTGLAVDAAGSIYVADRGNSRIQKFGAPTLAVTAAFSPTQICHGGQVQLQASIQNLEPVSKSVTVNGVVTVYGSDIKDKTQHIQMGPNQTVALTRTIAVPPHAPPGTVTLTLTAADGHGTATGAASCEIVPCGDPNAGDRTVAGSILAEEITRAVDSGATATTPSTWGGIKALYRR